MCTLEKKIPVYLINKTRLYNQWHRHTYNAKLSQENQNDGHGDSKWKEINILFQADSRLYPVISTFDFRGETATMMVSTYNCCPLPGSEGPNHTNKNVGQN